jgi:hypothetical protein
LFTNELHVAEMFVSLCRQTSVAREGGSCSANIIAFFYASAGGNGSNGSNDLNNQVFLVRNRRNKVPKAGITQAIKSIDFSTSPSLLLTTILVNTTMAQVSQNLRSSRFKHLVPSGKVIVLSDDETTSDESNDQFDVASQDVQPTTPTSRNKASGQTMNPSAEARLLSGYPSSVPSSHKHPSPSKLASPSPKKVRTYHTAVGPSRVVKDKQPLVESSGQIESKGEEKVKDVMDVDDMFILNPTWLLQKESAYMVRSFQSVTSGLPTRPVCLHCCFCYTQEPTLLCQQADSAKCTNCTVLGSVCEQVWLYFSLY